MLIFLGINILFHIIQEILSIFSKEFKYLLYFSNTSDETYNLNWHISRKRFSNLFNSFKLIPPISA